jgi:hypothetical protein
VAEAETWQEDTTVAVTLNEAVCVAARTSLEDIADVRRPNVHARVENFMDDALFKSSEERPE